MAAYHIHFPQRHYLAAHGVGLVAPLNLSLSVLYRQASKAARLNDLAAIPIPPPAKRPSELGASGHKTQIGSLFGNQPKEVDVVSINVELRPESISQKTPRLSDTRRFLRVRIA